MYFDFFFLVDLLLLCFPAGLPGDAETAIADIAKTIVIMNTIFLIFLGVY